MSEDNPFMSMVGLMQEQGGSKSNQPFFIGEVISASPLIVQIEGVQITEEDMFINEFLLSGYQRAFSMATTTATGTTQSQSGGSGDSSFSSHSHDVETIGIPSGTWVATSSFFVGDKVLLLYSENGQQFVLVCKVV